MMAGPYLLIIAILVIVFGAQWRVKSSYRKYSRVQSSSQMTAAQVAQRILDYGATSLGKPELREVKIESVKGMLSDHYDPRSKTLRLSQADSHSVADIGIAAHEAGHALQDAAQYGPLVMRSAMVPVTQFGSQLASFLALGAMFSFFLPFLFPYREPLLILLILIYLVIVAFSLVTLPVEFNASSRAMTLLRNTGSITSDKELAAVGTVLNSAALTYVAAAAAAILQLLYYVMLLLGSRR